MLTNKYVRKSTEVIWNETGYFQSLFEVMQAVIITQGDLNIIPQSQAIKISKQAKYDIKQIKELELTLRHETYAFITNVASYLEEDCRKYLHYGLTSSDLLDTALSLKLKRSTSVILINLTKIQNTLRDLAYLHKNITCVGRTHGIHAEPYSLGLKFALYYAEFNRHIERLKSEQHNVSIAKISGVLGNYAHITIDLEKAVAKKLNLRTTSSNVQVIPRDHLYYFMTVLVGIAATVEKISVEIRNMQRTEIGEWSESFTSTQKGSSAMPHKRNPIYSESLTGLSRVCRSGLSAMIENIALWHERDISHSSVERLIVPQTIMLLDYMTDKINNVLIDLHIDKKRISDNLHLSHNLIYSHKLMLLLIKKGMDRNQAHDLLQKISNDMNLNWPGAETKHQIRHDFLDLLKAHPTIKKYLTTEQIMQASSNHDYLKEVDNIYHEIFGTTKPK